MEKHLMTKINTVELSLPYLLHFPKDEAKNENGKYPLLLFLHGMGERGNQLDLLFNTGLPKMLKEGLDIPFLTVMPQCPADSFWTEETKALKMLMDDLVSTYPIDEHRIYITGLSMGGYGTYEMLIRYPELFAGGIPICGGIGSLFSKVHLSHLKDKPLWIFHGEKDDVVPVEETKEIVHFLKEAQSKNLKYTLYPDLSHDAWTRTYENGDIYNFLLRYKTNK